MDTTILQDELNKMREVRAKAAADGSDTAWIDQTIEELEKKLMLQENNGIPAQVEVPVRKLPFDFSTYTGLPSMNSFILQIIDDENEKVHKYYNETIDRMQSEIRALRGTGEEVINLRYQNAELQEKLTDTLNAKNQFEIERSDFESRWKAAGVKLEEQEEETRKKDAEIARLNFHVDDLRKQLADAPAPSASRIDVTPIATNLDSEAIKRQLDEERARKPKVTNVRWEDDFKKTHYLAEDIEDTTIRIPYMELGKYDVLNAEQVLQFRSEREAQRNHADSALVPPPINLPEPPEVTGDQFRSGNCNNSEAPMVGLNGGTEAGTSSTEEMATTANEASGLTLEQKVDILWQEREQVNAAKQAA